MTGQHHIRLGYEDTSPRRLPENRSSSIEDELLRCEQFCISVAFITMSGITPLLQTLKELERKGIPGKILTTDYLNFSDPRALEKLHGLSNIELKMYITEIMILLSITIVPITRLSKNRERLLQARRYLL